MRAEEKRAHGLGEKAYAAPFATIQATQVRRHDMTEKQLDRYRHAREERRRAYLSAPTLREQFPHVEQVVLQLSFTDHSGMSHYSPQTHTFSPAATAFFEIPCPSSMCTGGGFDLGGVVWNLIHRMGQETSGKLDCQGWQSTDHTDTHRSPMQLDYRLTVSYNS